MTTAQIDRWRAPVSRWSWGWVLGGSVAALGVGAAAGKDPMFGLGVLLMVVASYVVVVQPFAGVVLLAALTPATSAFRRGLIVPHLRPSEALTVWLVPLVILAARRPVASWGLLEWLGVAYAAATIALGAFDLWRRGAPFNSSNIDGLLGPAQYVLLLRAVRVGVKTDRHRLIVLRTLLLAVVPVAALALAQGFGVRWAQRLGVTLTGVNPGHLDRATGPFTNWQVLAGYLLAVGLISVAVAAFRAQRILSVRSAILLSLLIAAALARTLTIGAFAGWLVGSAALILYGRRIRISAARVASLVGFTVLLLALVLAARYKQEFVTRPGGTGNGIIPNTVMDRVNNWVHQYIPALSGRWVTGFGPDIPPDATWKFTDSVYVTIVLRGGLILLGIYTALMAGFATVARRVKSAAAEPQAMAAALLVLVIVLIPLQTIATYFTTSGLPQVIWILAALVSTLAVTRPQRP